MTNQYVAKDFYVYSAQLTSVLASGDNASDRINIEADSDFVIEKLTFSCFEDGTDDFQEHPGLTVVVVDTGSGRDLFEQPINIATIAGSGELPFILPTPKLINARSVIRVDFSNNSSIDLNRIEMNFIGKKLFL